MSKKTENSRQRRSGVQSAGRRTGPLHAAAGARGEASGALREPAAFRARLKEENPIWSSASNSASDERRSTSECLGRWGWLVSACCGEAVATQGGRRAGGRCEGRRTSRRGGTGSICRRRRRRQRAGGNGGYPRGESPAEGSGEWAEQRVPQWLRCGALEASRCGLAAARAVSSENWI